jgi:hypothetical protein
MAAAELDGAAPAVAPSGMRPASAMAPPATRRVAHFD